MRRHFSLVMGVVLLGSPVIAADPPGKVVLETWDAAYLNGGKSGFVHTVVRAVEKDNQKMFHAMTELDLSVKRFNDTARIYMQSGTVENEDGKVTSVSMKQLIAKGQELVLTGNVEDGQLHVKLQGGPPMDKKVRWSPQVVGLYREQTLFKEKKAKPGDQFSYLHYEPLVNAVLSIKVEVKDFEDVSILGAAKQRLLRAEATPDPIMGVQLPATNLWLDKDLNVIRSLTQMEGMGQLELVRSTRAAALRKGQANTDLGLRQLIYLNRRIPENADDVTYRITMPDEKDPATSFSRDERQKVSNSNGKSFDLNIKAIRRPPSASNETKVGEEFLKSNYYINSDDEKVRELASQAIGGEKDPWRKAQRIERWVRRNMNKEKQANYSEAMATADHVARTLEGDCTEYAMLAAAMCRAVGVPSRTAIGLVYAEVKATDYRPMLAFHMWTEVWINGQWLGLDATLGQGSVGAEHLKITDHSWDGVQSVVPLLPVTRVILGKPQVEVLQIKKEDR
ncbi:MAG TPA: transglutaminase domain-containing protein [Gemmataceae bacterium]|jgi:transglutaminase-like putative cysteine protease|nr:transglutaminase domain-containing protein [Gemmataceae bacterium]